MSKILIAVLLLFTSAAHADDNDCRLKVKNNSALMLCSQARTDGSGLVLRSLGVPPQPKTVKLTTVASGRTVLGSCNSDICEVFWPKANMPQATNDYTITYTLSDNTKLTLLGKLERP